VAFSGRIEPLARNRVFDRAMAAVFSRAGKTAFFVRAAIARSYVSPGTSAFSFLPSLRDRICQRADSVDRDPYHVS